MGALSKLNKKKAIDWNINTEDWKFKKPSELALGQEYSIKGVFITKGNFGEQGVVISDGFLVDAPSAELDHIKDILDDDELINAIKVGNEKFTVRTYQSKRGTTGYAFDYI